MHAIDGIHHITLITGDAPRNVDFYARVLGLRLVKKTVNQDDPSVYHLFYSDEHGWPGADITFFAYPGANSQRQEAGMIDRIVHRVGERAGARLLEQAPRRGGRRGHPRAGSAAVRRPRGRRTTSSRSTRRMMPALTARSNEVPGEFALRGFDSVHALVADPRPQRGAAGRRARVSPRRASTSGRRAASTAADITPLRRATSRGIPGAGTVHHIAWSVLHAEQEQWRERLIAAGVPPHSDHRPLLLRIGLLPRARRHSLRARDARRRRLCRGRSARDARAAARPTAAIRGDARADRAAPHPASASRWRPAPVAD